jgi:hypothetical protein
MPRVCELPRYRNSAGGLQNRGSANRDPTRSYELRLIDFLHLNHPRRARLIDQFSSPPHPRDPARVFYSSRLRL